MLQSRHQNSCCLVHLVSIVQKPQLAQHLVLMARTILLSEVKVSNLALYVLRNIFAHLHQQIIHLLSAVQDIFAQQDPKHRLKSLVPRELFAFFLWGLYPMIVLLALLVIFVPRRQCRLLFARLATFVHLLPTNRLPAPLVHLEILPCLRIQTIVYHAQQDFTVTEALRHVPMQDVIPVSIAPGALRHQLHPCSFALKEASAPRDPIFHKRVHLELSTTRLNLEILLSA